MGEEAAGAEMAAHVRSLETSLRESGGGSFDILRGEREPALE